MSETFDLELPDGRVLQGVPVGTTKAEISAKLGLTGSPRETTKPSSFLGEAAKTVGSALYGGVTAIPRLVMEGGNWLEKTFPTPDATKIPIPGYGKIAEADEAVRAGLRPETETGRTIARVGEAAVGAVAGPGGFAAPLRNLAIGAGGGVGAEVGGKLSGENAIARLAGGLAGGGVTALAASRVPTAQKMVREATAGVTPSDWRRAERTAATLDREDVPHLASQLLGPSSSLDDVVFQASSHPQVRPGLLGAVRNTAPKAQSAVERWKLGNLPVSIDEQRGLMQDIQGTAKEAEKAAIGRSNAAYREVMPEGVSYPSEYVETLKDELKALANSDKYGPTTVGGKAITRFADEHLTLPPGEGMSGAHLNNLVKDLNTLALEDGWKGLPVQDLKATLKSFTPEYDAARAAKTAVMQDEVNPMRQGLAGAIAQMGGGPKDNKYTATSDIMRMVFPADKAQPQAIRKLAEDIGSEQVGHIFREHLTKQMEHATKGLQGTEIAPAKFVEAISGTAAQRTNIEAALKEVATGNGQNPAAVRNGFYELMNAFATYKDLKLASGVAGANVQFEAGKNVAGLMVAPQSRAGRFLWERATAKTYQKISDLVTSPEGLKELEKIARTPDPKVKGALVRGVLAGVLADDSELSPGINTE